MAGFSAEPSHGANHRACRMWSYEHYGRLIARGFFHYLSVTLYPKLVKPGVNELAFYGNLEDRKGALFNAVEVYLEGLPKEQADEIKKQQDAIAPERIRELAKGKSNQEFHYLGSAYTYCQIGEAMAKGLIGMQVAK
jgi:hypothetical protein